MLKLKFFFIVIFTLLLVTNCSTKNEQKTTLKLEIEKLQKEEFEILKKDGSLDDTLSYDNYLKKLFVDKPYVFKSNFNNDSIKDALFVSPSSLCVGKGAPDKIVLIYSNNDTFLLDKSFSKKLESFVEEQLIKNEYPKPSRTLVSFSRANLEFHKKNHFFTFISEFDNQNSIIGDFNYLAKNKTIEINFDKIETINK